MLIYIYINISPIILIISNYIHLANARRVYQLQLPAPASSNHAFTVKEVRTPTVVASQPLKKPFCQVWPSAKEILARTQRLGKEMSYEICLI